MIRRLPLCLLVALAIGLPVAACTADTGPGAPARTNGCIGDECTFDAAILPTPVDTGTVDSGAAKD